MFDFDALCPRFMDGAGIERVWLSYFGTAAPVAYGIEYNYLPGYPFMETPRAQDATPWVAISATNLQGVYLPIAGVGADYFAAFRRREPVARVGYSIFVYRMEGRSGERYFVAGRRGCCEGIVTGTVGVRPTARRKSASLASDGTRDTAES